MGHQNVVLSSNVSALQAGAMVKLTVRNIFRVSGINNFHYL